MSTITEHTKFTEEEQRCWMYDQVKQLKEWLKQAKVNSVHELAGIPVEITMENRTFKSFRILEEVL
jgi:hypothetical protein